jgi:hypothetical protein
MTRSKTLPAWQPLLDTLRGELELFDEADRDWLRRRLGRIAVLQDDLDLLFDQAGGSATCARCDGACCGCGRHHLTLTNLLAYLLGDETPPPPDFSRTCPLLGESGCLLPASRRPYNCITFFCETLNQRLDEADRVRLCDLDRQLRAVYEEVAARYPLASLRGLWIALEQRTSAFLLRRREQS